MNSSVEEIFAKKCCNIPDQNLEIHLHNAGDREIVIQSFFDLEKENETKRIDNLFPWEDRLILPGETVAYYCFMEEEIWKRYNAITFFDSTGKRYSHMLEH